MVRAPALDWRSWIVGRPAHLAGKDTAKLAASENPQSANNVIRNLESPSIISTVENYPFVTSFVTPFIDIINHHNVYLHSSLASFSTLGPRGQSDIICKIPANASWGSTINHNVSSAVDYIDVSKRNLTSIRFAIKDANGHTINLNGASFSLSLVFAIKE